MMEDRLTQLEVKSDSNATAIAALENDMNDRFVRIETELSELRQKKADNELTLYRLDHLQDEMNRRFNESKEDVARRFGEMREDIDRRFSDAKDDMNRQFAAMREDMNHRFGEVGRQFGQVDNHFGQVDKL